MTAGRARVLVIGAGGIGSPALLALGRAPGPIRSLVIVDDDVVQVANLHRQILHPSAHVGMSKVRSAAVALAHSGLDITTVEARFSPENAASLLAGCDLVVDGSDNFATRFLANDACVLAGIPLVHAAAIGWQGQLVAFDPRRGDPCYRCLFEAAPAPGPGMSCAEAGVVGPVVGVIGSLAAEAAVALLDGTARSTAGVSRLVVYDGLAGTLRAVSYRRNPLCLACGPAARPSLDPLAYEVPACSPLHP